VCPEASGESQQSLHQIYGYISQYFEEQNPPQAHHVVELPTHMVSRDLLVADKLGTCKAAEQSYDARHEVYNLHKTNEHSLPDKASQNCHDRLNSSHFLGENPFS
jgi:hypothetical protein